jgi:hypothetical protein
MQSMYVKAQLFLGVSVIAAIAFVGCIFELTSGEPKWGSTLTLLILGGSLPLAIATFLQAVKLAKSSMNE